MSIMAVPYNFTIYDTYQSRLIKAFIKTTLNHHISLDRNVKGGNTKIGVEYVGVYSYIMLESQRPSRLRLSFFIIIIP